MNTNKKPLSRALLVLGIGSLAVLSSCTKDLDRFPTNGDTSKSVYDSPEKTLQAFAKVYGAYALTGNGDGQDIAGMDEGSSDFVRQLSTLGVTAGYPTSMHIAGQHLMNSCVDSTTVHSTRSSLPQTSCVTQSPRLEMLRCIPIVQKLASYVPTSTG